MSHVCMSSCAAHLADVFRRSTISTLPSRSTAFLGSETCTHPSIHSFIRTCMHAYIHTHTHTHTHTPHDTTPHTHRTRPDTQMIAPSGALALVHPSASGGGSEAMKGLLLISATPAFRTLPPPKRTAAKEKRRKNGQHLETCWNLSFRSPGCQLGRQLAS